MMSPIRWLRYRLYRVIYRKRFRPTPNSLVVVHVSSTGSVNQPHTDTCHLAWAYNQPCIHPEITP